MIIITKKLIITTIEILTILIIRELMRGISCVEDFIGNCSSIEERHVFQVIFLSISCEGNMCATTILHLDI